MKLTLALVSAILLLLWLGLVSGLASIIAIGASIWYGLKLIDDYAQRGHEDGTAGHKLITACDRGDAIIAMEGDRVSRVIIDTPGFETIVNGDNDWKIIFPNERPGQPNDYRTRFPGYEIDLGSWLDWGGYFEVGRQPKSNVRTITVDAANWNPDIKKVRGEMVTHSQKPVSYLQMFPKRRMVILNLPTMKPSIKVNLRLEVRLILRSPLVFALDQEGDGYGFVDSAVESRCRDIVGGMDPEHIKTRAELGRMISTIHFKGDEPEKTETNRLMAQSGYEFLEVVLVGWDYSESTEEYEKAQLKKEMAEINKETSVIDAQAQREIQEIKGLGEAAAFDAIMKVARDHGIDPNMVAAGYLHMQAVQEIPEGLLVYGAGGSGITIPVDNKKQKQRKKPKGN